MLKSCPYCGKLHEYNQICPKKSEFRIKYKSDRKRDSIADKFRNSRQWQGKRDEIQKRDCCMCRYCFCNNKQITTSDLSVHHIVPIEKNYDARLDNSNLITLCRYHHEQAEKGLIKADTLKDILRVPIKI